MKKIKKHALSITLLILCLFTLVGCSKHEHAYGAWYTVTNANCIYTGLKERVCECGEKETEVIPVTGHNYSSPTCTSPSKCKVCGEVSGEALGHNVTSGKCTRCYKTTFEFLKEHLIADGSDEFSDGRYSIILYVSDDKTTYVSINYDPIDDEIKLDCFVQSSKNSNSYLTTMIIKSTDTSSYQWNIISSENNFMKGYIYPNSYTKETTLIYTYSTYTNSSVNTSYMKLARAYINVMLTVYTGTITDNKISLQNLGFKVWTY